MRRDPDDVGEAPVTAGPYRCRFHNASCPGAPRCTPELGCWQEQEKPPTADFHECGRTIREAGGGPFGPKMRLVCAERTPCPVHG